MLFFLSICNSKSIVLGENNANTKIDCDNFNVCADAVQEFGPEKIIFPSNYNYPAFRHDIALIKLNKEAKISGEAVLNQSINQSFHYFELYFVYRVGNTHMFTVWRIAELKFDKSDW